MENKNALTTISVTKGFKQWLEEQKMIPQEPYEQVLKRLLGLKEK